jgi:REP element-mobilizing transposase RayT
MAHTFTNLLAHIIFSTKDRAPLLTPDTRPRLFAYMGGIIRDQKAIPILLNGPEDHIHILTALSTTTALSDFMRELKSVSSG